MRRGQLFGCPLPARWGYRSILPMARVQVRHPCDVSAYLAKARASSDIDPDARPGTDARVGIPLICLMLLVAVGSFGTWLIERTQHLKEAVTTGGMEHWRGPGWISLVLAIAAIVVLLSDLKGLRGWAPVTATTLMGALIVVTGYFAVEFALWFEAGPNATFSVGWGLWLCLSSSILGVVVGTLWVRRLRFSDV